MGFNSISILQYLENVIRPFIIVLFFLLLIAVAPNSIRAQTVIFEDDFENGLDKWQELYSLFENWQIVNGMVQIYLPNYSMRSEITPKIIWKDNWQYYRITFDYYALQGIDRNINFGFKSYDEWYELHFVDGNFYLSHVVDGSPVWSYTGQKTLSSGELHKFKIDLNRGRIIVLINNELLLDKTDPTYNGSFGKPTLKATTGAIYPTTVNYDNYKILLMEEPDPDAFPIFKQTNPQWSDHEYDHAFSWAQDASIGRWGCALSSLAMILNFYDISKLPDDSDLDPLTLNDWLKSQDDGYIGEGLVNWIAGMRLTRLMSPILNTPKLEYSRQDADPMATATSEISAGRPVILQIPGHFLAAYQLAGDDLEIVDPAFHYSLFSQHQEDLISTRTFTPSNTDLSYLLATHNPDLNLQFTTPNSNNSALNEYLEADSSPQTLSETLVIHEVPKPNIGNYDFEISQSEYGPFEIKFYLYDNNAEVKIINYTGYAGPTPERHLLVYNKNDIDDSEIEPVVTFAELLAKVQNQYHAGKISPAASLHLQKYLTFAANSETNQAPDYQRYIALIKYYLLIFDDQIAFETTTALDNYLLNLEESFANPVSPE